MYQNVDYSHLCDNLYDGKNQWFHYFLCRMVSCCVQHLDLPKNNESWPCITFNIREGLIHFVTIPPFLQNIFVETDFRLTTTLINAFILSRSGICAYRQNIKAKGIQINYALWNDGSNYHFGRSGSKGKYTWGSYEWLKKANSLLEIIPHSHESEEVVNYLEMALKTLLNKQTPELWFTS